jgi:hypothetical protein
MNTNINSVYLLSDQEVKEIYICLKYWRNISYSSRLINRANAIRIVKKSYNALELPIPQIVFKEGYISTKSWIRENYSTRLNCDNYRQLNMNLRGLLFARELSEDLFLNYPVVNQILGGEGEKFHEIYWGSYELFDDVVENWLTRVMSIELELVNNAYNQYCIDNLHWKYDRKVWEIISTLNQECPHLIPLSKACIVIDRPTEVHLDNELLPHAQNKPAIRFADGFAVYCYHGIPFPAKYGDIPTESWQSEWILSEGTDEYKSILIYTVGYKRFIHEFPNYDFWQDRARLLCESVDIIINWQLYHYNQLYLKQQQTDELKINPDDAIKIIDSLPFKLPTELANLYQYYNGGYQLIPGLYFYPLKQAIQALSNLNCIKSDIGYPFPLFKGTRDEIYYVLADDPEPTYSHVYCQFPDAEPVIYAECVTSLIVTIAQCYQEGAYYIAINEETGERSIEQDLDKIEPIFEKFNPDQIDNWRKIWKGKEKL